MFSLSCNSPNGFVFVLALLFYSLCKHKWFRIKKAHDYVRIFYIIKITKEHFNLHFRHQFYFILPNIYSSWPSLLIVSIQVKTKNQVILINILRDLVDVHLFNICWSHAITENVFVCQVGYLICHSTVLRHVVFIVNCKKKFLTL